MGHALQTVHQFLDLTNTHKDIHGAAGLMDPAIRFTGPAIRTSGVAEYVALLEQFVSAHVGWKLLRQFEDGDEVCVFDEIMVRTPAGDTLTLTLAEWFQVADGRITEHRVYYDPRPFIAAFGIAEDGPRAA